MPYQYGMQNSPSGGNGLGGLPKKQTTPKQVNFTRIVTAGSGTILPPANAKYMRVAAIGTGGAGYAVGSSGTQASGSGAGCAASKIVPASPISYTISATSGSNTTATFPGYSLVGGGGLSGFNGSGVQLGGIGVGGDYNFQGGSSAFNSNVASGGGGAGPNGNGGNGSAAGSTPGSSGGQSGLFSGTGWGVGGGAGGPTYVSGGDYLAVGGAGFGSFSGSIGGSPGSGVPATTNPTGGPSQSLSIGSGFASTAGGVGGGGGGAGYTASSAGGIGCVLVEWFYD